ncbi:UPF0565 protein C2orf69-like isoform X2 [Leptotrombidium deliense]|uniref:UPF0565 protein C2orf69-like isoform X2 n=1 Tax=Leptotrombidium deliense TaxID=299467 RepID=A0A443SM91_9ACAR|nr:UPF0565 protein C2orf69-like isoform X2 [Leptotrombidium deliense]
MDSKNAVLTLRNMQGTNGNRNDVVVCPSNERTENALIYFGGDIQDNDEHMRRQKSSYTSWSLENTALILHDKFPQHSIFVIKPSKMTMDTIAVYRNFVESNSHGVPSHKYDLNCLKHLKCLMESVFEQITPAPNITSFTCMGFSKGCVVLNQLLYCFAYLTERRDDDLSNFASKISHMYWLDGGHSGGCNTWITDETLVKSLSSFNIQAEIHVTPYQMNDKSRPWKREECTRFCELLNQFNIRNRKLLYFEQQEPSINLHFQLLNDFKP